ncbi:hypothetical protein DPMN_124734 [Dreissena polymorpha]|uniref:Uncharacterized protein n=1 Tax=Dreissena polymorpha TaxID=45954 RepID=A0A9D4GTU1_DREPO|nr:hypothetical protein DPMN_124734 [Dreissena polymorpha]
MNVFCISVSSTFFKHQRSFPWPAVVAVWLDHTSTALTAINEEGRSVTLAGDGRCDSPGHYPKYAKYTFIDMATGHVIGLHLVQVRHWS